MLESDTNVPAPRLLVRYPSEANIETATKLLKLGLDKSLIMTATGISLEQLEQLKKELGF